MDSMMSRSVNGQGDNFEEELLKYVQDDKSIEIKELLLKRLEDLEENNVTQITLISCCLLDVLLRMKSGEVSDHDREMLDIEIHTLLDEPKVIACLRPLKKKVYDLMSSVGDEDNWLFFAKLMNDSDALIDFWIKRNRPKDALDVLLTTEMLTSSQLNQLLIKYGYFLFKSHPKEIVQILKKSKNIKPLAILPCLLQGNNCRDEKLMRYLILFLEDSLNREGDPVVLNYLLLLYAQFDDKKLSAALEKFSSDLNFECVFVLDTCLKNNLKNNSVKILEKMSLHEDAVKEAVSSNNLALAQNIVKNNSLDAQRKKKLWLTIAQSVLTSNQKIDVSKFIQESTSEEFSVIDILPLLPDFTKIDLFKNDICNALLDYSDSLQTLKEEMEETSNNVNEAKEEQNKWRKQSISIPTWTSCSLCRTQISSHSFLAFPCQHFFHYKCFNNSNNLNMEAIDCPLCGQDMIDSIDQPLPRCSFDSNWT